MPGAGTPGLGQEEFMDAGTQDNVGTVAGCEPVWRLACAELGVDLLEYEPVQDQLRWSDSCGHFRKWLGWDEPQIGLQHFLDFIEPRHRLLARRSIEQGRGFEVLLRRNGKAARWLQFRPMREAEGVVYACRDNTEARRMGTQLSECIEQERQRFAECLHDDICQQLVGISLLGHRLCKALEQCRPAEAAEANEMCLYLNDALARVRRLSKGLSGSIESEDLGCLLRQLGKDVQRLFQIQVDVQLGAVRSGLSREVVRKVYQIMREAIYNAAKHCKGCQVRVSVQEKNRELVAVVEDDGTGFGQTLRGGMGLELMRCRAISIGARLELSKANQGGAKVVCTLPLE